MSTFRPSSREVHTRRSGDVLRIDDAPKPLTGAEQRDLAEQHEYQRYAIATGVITEADLVDGEPRITPHQLRYTFGSLLIDAGVPTATVARLMGHANEAITGAIYAHEIRRAETRERTRASLRKAFGSGTKLERSGSLPTVSDVGYQTPSRGESFRDASALRRRIPWTPSG